MICCVCGRTGKYRAFNYQLCTGHKSKAALARIDTLARFLVWMKAEEEAWKRNANAAK